MKLKLLHVVCIFFQCKLAYENSTDSQTGACCFLWTTSDNSQVHNLHAASDNSIQISLRDHMSPHHKLLAELWLAKDTYFSKAILIFH